MSNKDRLLTELQNIKKSRKYLFYAHPSVKPNILSNWNCGFPGPDEELYKNSYYTLIFKFPPTYPFNPPTIMFKNFVYHPNVYKNGHVCLDIIQSKWKPSMNVVNFLTALQSFLVQPNVKSPANAEAGYLYVKDNKKYCENVRLNIIKYHTKYDFDKI